MSFLQSFRKIKNAFVSNKETKAQTSAVPLFLPECDIPTTQKLPGNGGVRRGLLLVQPGCSEVIFVPSYPPFSTDQRLSVESFGDYSSSSSLFVIYSFILAVFSGDVKGFWGKKRPPTAVFLLFT